MSVSQNVIILIIFQHCDKDSGEKKKRSVFQGWHPQDQGAMLGSLGISGDSGDLVVSTAFIFSLFSLEIVQ